MEQRQPKDYLCYCGLYCKMCSMIAITPKHAGTLLESLKEDGWENFGPYVYQGFDKFWEILNALSRTDITTTLCRGDCGNPDCEIRICARTKHLDVCALCDDYPCDKLQELSGCYPFILQNNDRIKVIGLEKWLLEQEKLVAEGLNNRILRDRFVD